MYQYLASSGRGVIALGLMMSGAAFAQSTGTVDFKQTIVITGAKSNKGVGGVVTASISEDKFFRIFGVVDTGAITSFGTRAYVSAARVKNNVPFNNVGKIDKQQYNAKIYQPIGDNGDFVSIAGHYNENRNNFFGSLGLRRDRAVPSGFPLTKDARFRTRPRRWAGMRRTANRTRRCWAPRNGSGWQRNWRCQPMCA